MSALAEFLQLLLDEGTIYYREPPVPTRAQDPQATSVLARAFAQSRLDIAGPLLEFDAATAWAAAELVQQAGWFLLSRQEPEAELERRLQMPGPPRTAAQHLSADLTLRYLVRIHRQAQALAPADHLVTRLSGILRQWPLTGVLSAVTEAPETPLDFAGHPGLLLLYAERLADNEKQAWVPDGPAFEYVELVFAGLGRRLPVAVAKSEQKEEARA